MRLEIVVAVGVYAAVLLAVGLRFREKVSGLDAFFLASRRVGAARIAFSLCASWIGAASLLVSTDEAFAGGISAYWVIGLPAVVTLLGLVFLVRPIRALAGETISDRMEACYGRAARAVTTILIVWYMMALAGSQLVAAGEFVRGVLGVPYFAGLAGAAAVLIIYSWAGGFAAVVRTHTLQFFLLLLGVAALLVSLISPGAWEAVGTTASALGKTGYFRFFSGAGRNALIALSFVLAWTISPIAWQRMQAAKSEDGARRGLAGAAGVLALFYAGIVGAGMLFLPMFRGSAPGGPLIAAYIDGKASGALGGLLFVTVLAAIFSTADAAVNTGAFSLTADLFSYAKQKGDAEKQGSPTVRDSQEIDKLSWAAPRVATLVVGGGAFLVAARFQDILRTLGLASKIMAEGLFVPGMAALLWRRRAPLAGLLSLAAGGGYALLGFLDEAGLRIVDVPPWPGSLLPGVGLSIAGFVVGFALERLRPVRHEKPRSGGIST